MPPNVAIVDYFCTPLNSSSRSGICCLQEYFTIDTMKGWILFGAALLMSGALSCGRCGKAADKTAAATRAGEEAVVVADSLPVKIDIVDDLGRIVIRKAPRQQVEVEFDSGTANLLDARITGVSDTANIRFNGIVMPGGASDGPFGRSMEYDLARKGMYRLLIGESLMQGDPWGGDFTLEIRLSQTVPYTLGRNYYVLNSFTDSTLRTNTITTRQEFDAVFGKAAVMGSFPTPIDFDKQYVIAVVEPMTDDAVHLEVTSLLKTGDRIVLVYDRKSGEKRSYFVRPFLMLIVDREYSGVVEVRETRS